MKYVWGLFNISCEYTYTFVNFQSKKGLHSIFDSITSQLHFDSHEVYIIIELRNEIRHKLWYNDITLGDAKRYNLADRPRWF